MIKNIFGTKYLPVYTMPTSAFLMLIICQLSGENGGLKDPMK